VTESKKTTKTNDNYLVPALKRGLQILDMFSEKARVLTINDFAERLGVSSSSIYRTVVTLTELNYLKKINRNSYELGPMVLSNGFIYLASREIVQVAAPYILELRDESSSSCHLAIREGLQAIYLYRAPSPQKLSVNVPIGSRFPCHSVAAGRSLLTGLKDAQITDLFSGVALDRSIPPSPTSLPLLRQIIAEDRKRGFSQNRSDSATAIAVPVKNYAGEVIAAVNISAPDTLMGEKSVRKSLTTLLIKTANRISAELGGLD
jgi:IclR family pca regulon transcriptional regulator